MGAVVSDVAVGLVLPPVRGTATHKGGIPGWRHASRSVAYRCPTEADGLPVPEVERASADGKARTIRVLLADDHAIVRESLARLLSGQQGLEVVGLAGDGQQAVEMALALRPDVIVMDVSMPRLNGMQATRRIKDVLPRTHVIALSMYKEAEMGEGMRTAGASGYLAKTSAPMELVKAIRACLQGGS